MDNSNTNASYEDCISMATMGSCNTPESGDCSPSNDDTTNAFDFKSIIADVLSDDYASYFIDTGDCISMDSASGSSEIGDCICALIHNIFDATNIGNDLLSSVLSNGTSNTKEICECPTKGLSSVHDESCTKDFCEYLADSVSSEKIMIDIFRVITELIKISYTHNELNGKNLRQIKRELEELQDKGLYTDKIASEIQKIAKENLTNEISMKDFYKILGTLNNFSCLEKYVNCVIADAHSVKNLKQMKFVTETGQLTEKMLSALEIIDKGKDDIQRDFAKLKLIDIPGIVDFMKTLEGLGLLSEVLIYKLTNIGREAIDLSTAIHSQIMIVDDTIKDLKKLLSKSKLKDEDTPSKKIDKQPQDSICRFEHNIPFCGKCGWRNSWVKAFKRRGVYVKEVESANEKQIWINSINES